MIYFSFQVLVERGIDPMMTNKKQINVLHLMAKRNQVEMASCCLEKVAADKAKEFVNNSSTIGWTVLIQVFSLNCGVYFMLRCNMCRLTIMKKE